jgi:hypothetical protein
MRKNRVPFFTRAHHVTTHIEFTRKPCTRDRRQTHLRWPAGTGDENADFAQPRALRILAGRMRAGGNAGPRRYGHLRRIERARRFRIRRDGQRPTRRMVDCPRRCHAALAQTGTHFTDDRFPLAIYRSFSGRNVYVSIHFMPVSGKVDRAGGGATDAKVPGPGRVGMWTKADSVTWFESIRIKSLD